MTYRRFSDLRGNTWEAWEVHPLAVERRVNDERRAQSRGEGDRRREHEFRLVIPRELARGWLALQNGPLKLRVSPIPEGWLDLADHELIELAARSAAGAEAAS